MGETGLEVPVIGMGTWRTFDTPENRRPVVDEAPSAGMTLFDSSPMYGRAELTLTRALPGRRAQAQIATRVWTEDPGEGGRQTDDALRLFGHVDVYQAGALLPLAEELGVGVFVMSPLQGGILQARPGSGELRALGVRTWPQAVLTWIAMTIGSARC